MSIFPGQQLVEQAIEGGKSLLGGAQTVSSASDKLSAAKEGAKGITGKALDYLNPLKTIPAFKEACKVAMAQKDTGFFEKVGLFFTTFFAEMGKLEKKEEAVTAETEATVKAALASNQPGLEASGPTIDEATVEKEGSALISSLSKTFASTLDQVDENDKDGDAHKAEKRIRDDIEGKPLKELTLKESANLAAAGLMTLKALKDKYPNPGDFKRQLDILAQHAKSEKSPIKRFLAAPILTLLKPSVGIGDLAGEGGRLLKAMGIGMTDVMAVKDKFMMIREPMDEAKLDQLTALLNDHVFTNSNPPDIKRVAKKLNEMITQGKKTIATETLTDFVFLIDDDDYGRLITILTGKSHNPVALAG